MADNTTPDDEVSMSDLDETAEARGERPELHRCPAPGCLALFPSAPALGRHRMLHHQAPSDAG